MSRRSRGGAGMLVLSGKWQLDKERSQSLYPHMKAMGCDEIAALASEKLNLVINIAQTKDALNIWQHSQLGSTHRTVYIGAETTEASPNGDRKITVRVTEDVVVLETVFPKGRLLDTRVLVEGGSSMLTMLELSINGANEAIKTRRYFTRAGDPDKEVVGAMKGLLQHVSRNSSAGAVQPLLPPAPEPVVSAAPDLTAAGQTAAAPPAAPPAMAAPTAGASDAMEVGP